MTEAVAGSIVWNDKIHVSKHPVLFHKISILRSTQTQSSQFRSVLKEVTYHLGYEATAHLNTKDIPVSVASVTVGKDSTTKKAAAQPLLDCIGHKIADKVALIPILRSGLAMTDGMLDLLPKASVHHIGMYHIPGARPVQYFTRLPRHCASDIAFVVDPVIASAETILAVVAILKKWGVPKIHIVCVLASKQGLQKIQEMHPDIYVTVGTIDEVLTENGVVLPGLGDVGNRLYATEPMLDEDESLLLPSKRKRSVDLDLDE